MFSIGLTYLYLMIYTYIAKIYIIFYYSFKYVIIIFIIK